MLNIKKRGAGHLEIIISFVFFISFIFFFLLFLNPFDRSSLSDSVIIGVSESLKNNLSTNLTTVFLEVDRIGGGAFSVNLPQLRYPFTNSFMVDAGDNSVINSRLYPDGQLTGDGTRKYYRLYISDEFPDSSFSGAVINSDFTLGSIIYTKPLSYRLFQRLKTIYENDYQNLKSELGVPEVLDFSILSDELPELNLQKTLPQGVEVYSKVFFFEILKSDATVTNARFRILVW